MNVFGSEERHLSWARFQSLIENGIPAVEVVGGTPSVQLFSDPEGARIGLRTPNSGMTLPPSPLLEIDIRQGKVDGIDVIEVSTRNAPLFRDFYAFACALADRLQLNSLPPDRAIQSALNDWAALLRSLVVLSKEKEVGLMGELWLLMRVAEHWGWDNAADSWKGTASEEHDFSLPHFDVEVKTTTSERRNHMIGSLTQLQPTDSRPLYLLSLQFTDAGAGPGITLADSVADVRSRIEHQSNRVNELVRGRLRAAGWQQEHGPHYRRRLTLRTPPALVHVDQDFPAIVPQSLVSLGIAKLSRLSQISYRTDITGLGFEDGTEMFLSALPGGNTAS